MFAKGKKEGEIVLTYTRKVRGKSKGNWPMRENKGKICMTEAWKGLGKGHLTWVLKGKRRELLWEVMEWRTKGREGGGREHVELTMEGEKEISVGVSIGRREREREREREQFWLIILALHG